MPSRSNYKHCKCPVNSERLNGGRCTICGEQAKYRWTHGIYEMMGTYRRATGTPPIGPHRKYVDSCLTGRTRKCEICDGLGLLDVQIGHSHRDCPVCKGYGHEILISKEEMAEISRNANLIYDNWVKELKEKREADEARNFAGRSICSVLSQIISVVLFDGWSKLEENKKFKPISGAILEGGTIMNGEQKSLSTPPLSELEKINERSIRGFDNRYKDKFNISSRLYRYEDGAIYLKIVNMKTHFPSNYDTALKFAREWKSFNEEELRQAKGFVVLFCGVDLKGETGWPSERRLPVGCTPCWYNPYWNNKVLDALSNWQSKELDGIFSGLFEDQVQTGDAK